MARLTFKRANALIQAKYPGIYLCDTEGYLHIWSDDEATQLKISGMYENSLGVHKLNHCRDYETLMLWVTDLI
jgi:hypothetical protein